MNSRVEVKTSHKIKVNEELLRQYFEAEWGKLLSDPDLAIRHGMNRPVVDVLKDEAKKVIENVLKRFRP